MKESAATALVTLARKRYRLVRDKTTDRVYAVPQGEGEPICFPLLGDVLALAYFEHECKVASAAAKKDALAVLQAMPVVETAEIVKPPPPPDPEEVARQLAELEAACAGRRGGSPARWFSPLRAACRRPTRSRRRGRRWR